MKLPPSSILASIALANLPLISASAILNSAGNEGADPSAVDTGILSSTTNHLKDAVPEFVRHLQGGANCPSTCSSELCSCVAQYGYAEPCSQQLNDVCTGNAGTISDCVVSEYVEYYQNVYCPFAACRVSGGSYEKCQCESYIDFCNVYQNKEGYMALPKTLQYCSIANCCLKEDQDVGRKSCLDETFKDLGGGDGVVSSIGDLIEGGGGGATSDSSGGESSSGSSTDGSKEVAPPSESAGYSLENSMMSVVVGVLGWFMMG